MSEAVNESRRNFLRLALAIPVGAAAGAALYPANEALGSEITEHTGIQTGNASNEAALHAACDTAPSYNACAADQMDKMGTKASVGGPIIEEMCYRAVPSLMSDMVDMALHDDVAYTAPPKNVAVGTGTIGMTRNELITGALTTAVFGFGHNVSANGDVDTRTLPVQSLIGGGVLWVLQRKLGFAANLTAHSVYNFRWLHGFRSGRSH